MTELKKFPIPSTAQEDLEEALGLVWYKFESGTKKKSAIQPALADSVGAGTFELLKDEGYVRENGDEVSLTETGERLAKDITRRHRLAERLLSDVLNLDKGAIDPNACQLEHILSPEVSASICTLLGHPKECPHGSLIPTGECCTKSQNQVESLVVSLDKLAAGENGAIAYMLLQNHPELHKLLSLGVVPGTRVHLHQTYPTYVIEMGESQLALEENVAKNIYIRRN